MTEPEERLGEGYRVTMVSWERSLGSLQEVKGNFTPSPRMHLKEYYYC
jgi:hypothetical protein